MAPTDGVMGLGHPLGHMAGITEPGFHMPNLDSSLPTQLLWDRHPKLGI